MIRRVGNGETTNMWKDPWLPREGGHKPITPKRQNLLQKVNELMDPHTGQRDMQLVNEVLWPIDAKEVQAIPIHEEVEDFWAWQPEEKGIFTVKSAYKL